MDSTACLVGSDAPHFNLMLEVLPAGQSDLQEDNPIPCHPKRKMCLVAAGLDFLGSLRREPCPRATCLPQARYALP